jgi:hypothetical protein
MTNDENDAFEIAFPAEMYARLQEHLFSKDGLEHGAVVLAGLSTSAGRITLLVRDLILAVDGQDYARGPRGYKRLDPLFIARAAARARDEGWVYLAVHNHGGSDAVAFSSVDLASHERGYPAIRQITGRAVGGLVFARESVAGDLWLADGRRLPLSKCRVLARNIKVLAPSPRHAGHERDARGGELFDRQARMFGRAGQLLLAEISVAVVGLGGAGSMASEMLARLGVGRLTLIDPDRLEVHNIPRVVGSRMSDVDSRGGRVAVREGGVAKVDIAGRTISEAGLPVHVRPLACDVSEAAAIQAISACDWIILAADSQVARHVVNAVAHAFLIPVVQLGVKIPVDADTGRVGDVFAVSRRMLPDAGCMWCNGLIDPTRLQLEAVGAEEARRAQAYVGPDAPAPSVITLNGYAVSTGLTDLLFATMGLHVVGGRQPEAVYQRWSPRTGRHYSDEPRRDPQCPHCGSEPDSLLARGDDATLPVRPG